MRRCGENVVIGDNHKATNRLSAFPRRCWPVLLVFCASAACAQVYQITDLGVLPGQSSSSAVGINKSGQIAGNSGSHAFLYSSGAMTDLGSIPGSTAMSASSLNNKGQIVGTYTIPGQYPYRGFLWDNATLSDPFDDVTYLSSQYLAIGLEPVGINDSGQVALNEAGHLFQTTAYNALIWQGAGSQLTPLFPSGNSQAYAISNSQQVTLVEKPYYSFGAIWSPSGTTALPPLGYAGAGYGPTPYGINDSGQTVGEGGANSGGSHAFLWTSGTITDLGTLGGVNSVARGVNNAGLIVGDSETVNGSPNRHAFVYSAGQMLDLNNQLVNPQLWQLQTAVGINDLGQITGTGTYGGATHAFLLTPQASNSIYPSHGGNVGKVTILILSPGFVPSTVQLVGAGTISGTAIAVPSFLPSAVQVTFDLTGAQAGVYSLALSQGSGTPLTLPNVFTVDQGGSPNIKISVAGFPQLRVSRAE